MNAGQPVVSPDPALPFGVTASAWRDPAPRVVVRAGAAALDVAALADRGIVSSGAGPGRVGWWQSGSLDAFLAAGRTAWQQVLGELRAAVSDPAALPADAVLGLDEVQLVLPYSVADYVDFYASEHHAMNLGRILRPGQPALPPNWRHLPIGYHGRSGTVVVSGTPVRRPRGQHRVDDADRPEFGPTQRLDVEVEVGFVVGAASRHGEPVPVEAFAEHVFGVCLVNDWSARDIQAWEYQPLGPFLGKSFATSVSAWVVPLEALEAARVPVASAATELTPYLREVEPWGLDVSLELSVNGEVLTRPPFSSMFWSAAQMLAHQTVNGASVRTGDLFASGTVSGSSPDEVGSLIELSHNTKFLADGDDVVIRATAPGSDGTTVDLGEVRGSILPALG
ncbi:MAG: fumarylacetoacetase [Frankiaceae bacterium]|nr:fumarylacetoacetase [Frankiaceae bacterium]